MSQVLVEKMPMGTKLGTQVTVPTTAAGIQLLAANPRRISAAIYNLGPTNTIYLAVSGAAAVVATAYPVPVGSSFLDTETTDAWFAIAGVAGCDVRLIEVTSSLQAG